MGALAAAAVTPVSATPIEMSTIEARLEALGVFGRPAGGSFRDGVIRVGLDAKGWRQRSPPSSSRGPALKPDLAPVLFVQFRRGLGLVGFD